MNQPTSHPDSRVASPRRPAHTPSFDAGLIPEPLLLFGGRNRHVDPRAGLALFGPYGVADSQPILKSITVGIVGPSAMISDAEQWIGACRGMLTNDGSQPLLYPHFPGMNGESAFACELVTGDTWNEVVGKTELAKALAETNFFSRVKRVAQLYIAAISILAERDPTPDVVLCCIPQDVVDLCTTRHARGGEEIRRRLSKTERRLMEELQRGQMLLFSEMDPRLNMDEHENLRRAIKAEAMEFGIPTQLVWPRTLRLAGAPNLPGESVQDVATRAWNFTTAIYYKAGGCPWRVDEIEEDVCFVGVSFYRELRAKNFVRTAMAQAFTSSGDGYVLRGNSFEWNDPRSSPHLDERSASSLISDVLDLYRRQNRGALPRRVVIHKSSKYTEDELRGFESACSAVPRHDFIALGGRGIQFYRAAGSYPPLRGTYVKLSDAEFVLYTSGYVPFLRTYPGARVPRPLEVVEHHGDSPWSILLQELMALTKLDWNNANFASREPVTLAFSRRVGLVLAELPPRSVMRQEYRYYM